MDLRERYEEVVRDTMNEFAEIRSNNEEIKPVAAGYGIFGTYVGVQVEPNSSFTLLNLREPLGGDTTAIKPVYFSTNLDKRWNDFEIGAGDLIGIIEYYDFSSQTYGYVLNRA